MGVKREMSNDFIPGETFIGTGLAIYGEEEKQAVRDVLDSGHLGLYTEGEEFERRFAEHLGVERSLLVNSGSSASLLALAGIKEAYSLNGGEVITPACNFPTSLNPIIQLGFKPVFVDVDETYNPSPEQIREAVGPETQGIVFAHTLGNPAKVEEIARMSEDLGLFLLEDCCDAYGATYVGEKCGSFGTASIASFYPAHSITLGGEGGSVNVNDPELYKTMKSLRDWGRDCTCKAGEDDRCKMRFGVEIDGVPYDHKYVFSTQGFNLKPTEMQAAFGLEQLKRLGGFDEKRRQNFRMYSERFSQLGEFFEPVKINPGADPVFFGFPLMIRDSVLDRRDLAVHLNEKMIGTRYMFGGNLLRQPAYQGIDCRVSGKLEQTDRIFKDLLWVGLHPGLGKREIDYVGDVVESYVKSK
jgi:CDP-4-dehydro-6-deoxyglucose reductase, E1